MGKREKKWVTKSNINQLNITVVNILSKTRNPGDVFINVYLHLYYFSMWETLLVYDSFYYKLFLNLNIVTFLIFEMIDFKEVSMQTISHQTPKVNETANQGRDEITFWSLSNSCWLYLVISVCSPRAAWSLQTWGFDSQM